MTLALHAMSEAVAESDASTPHVVEARSLSFRYRSGIEVLRALDLELRAGEITVILGGSGSGKTTLLRLIAGLLRPSTGAITVLGVTPAGKRLNPRVAYVPQQLGLTRARSALENALVGALGHTSWWRSLLGAYAEEDRARALEVLRELGLEDKAGVRVQTLSGGERQRVAIARALMQRPRVLLADEFVSQLDAVTSREVLEQMRRMAAEGVAVIMSTHELDLALTFADRLLVLRDGGIALDAAAGDLDEQALTAAIRK